MTPRRFMVHMTLPRTLLEDEEAFQFLCRGYWDEMLRVAGGTPAEEPVVRAFRADTQPEDVESDGVYVHVIGYAEPAMPAEEVMRHRYPAFVSRYITAETNAVVEPEMPTYTLSELMAHISDIARPFNYDSVVNALIGAQVSIPIRAVDDDMAYRQPTEYDFITHPQQNDENWEYGNDVARWYPEMEDD